MVEMLKYTTANMSAMENKMVALRDKIKEHKQNNHDLSQMLNTLKRVLKHDNEDARTLRKALAKYKFDQHANYVFFFMNDTKIFITRDQMRQLVTWYKPGKVYFEPTWTTDDLITVDVVRKFYFGEVVYYVDHNDKTNCVDALVTYEDETVVGILTMDMIIQQRHLTPMHVLKFLVQRKSSTPDVILSREQVGEFLMSIGHVGKEED